MNPGDQPDLILQSQSSSARRTMTDLLGTIEADKRKQKAALEEKLANKIKTFKDVVL